MENKKDGSVFIDESNKFKNIVNDQNYFDYVLSYECNELDTKGILALFQYLVNTGLAYTLQGHYGRTANYLLFKGFIKNKRK